ncbi:P-loop containing nucleoside triphosphate hydrolase protein [Melanogaster broomeanus]|nr:P-loop containing nucleoside triphosphate hydrolase protein [Melanogaster broomeanus]
MPDDNRAGTPNEKAPVKGGVFFRNRTNLPSPDEQPDVTAVDAKPVLEDIPPVAFTDLFRYSTRFELIIAAVGLVSAAAAGAAQPLMSLIFGNLTQDFVDFGNVALTYFQTVQTGNATAIATAQQALDATVAEFRQSVAVDASHLVYMGISMFVSTYTYMVIWIYIGEVNSKRIREKYLQAILRQEIAYFDNVGAGEVTTRIQTDTHLVQQGMSEKVALIVNFISVFLTGFTLGYARNWRLALAVSSVLLCVGVTGGIMYKIISKYTQLSLKHIAESGTLAEEVVSTVRTAHAFGTQKVFNDLYDVHVMAVRAVDMKAGVFQGVALGLVFFVIYSGYALAFQFGTTLINEGHATAGEVVNVFMAILIGSLFVAQLVPQVQAQKAEGKITFEGVKFSYPSRPDVPVFKSINVTFPAGKTAALVGVSGSGKSTIIALVERFYDPLCGSVKLDGVDIRDLNIKWLRSQIGLVSQEPTLFATTIKGNIAHGLVNTSYERLSEEEKFRLIKEACIKANADGFISKLPEGYDTMVGERGFLLSGGQKQRVAIARAIVSDPRILLLDEATSALDSQSEGIVQDALDKAAAGRTTITIAHRLSTIKDADCIYVIGDGVILEQGTHAELMAFENGAYLHLVHTQKLRQRNDGGYSDGSPRANVDREKVDVFEEEVRLGHENTNRSIASDLVQKSPETKSNEVNEDDYGMFYLFLRIGALNRDGLWRYALGTMCAIMTGMVYPALGIVYGETFIFPDQQRQITHFTLGQAIAIFSATDPSVRRIDANRNALWFFIIAILSSIVYALQIYYLASSASILTSKLRSLGFKSLLRQDIGFFDKDENSTGALTANLSDNPQKIDGLAGITLGAIIQAIATLIRGSQQSFLILDQSACIPFLFSVGYIRLHVLVLRDQQNKSAHQRSAQLACEAVASIRTVASLTREEDCLNLYSTCLEEPLKKSNKTAVWSNGFYAFSQSMSFFVIALIFWYGSKLIASLEITITAFYVTLMSIAFGTTQAGNVFSFVPDISAARGKTLPEQSVLGQIRLENVHFRYPTRPGVRVLRDLSIKVEPGTYVALVGASGCGKSTIIQLIERFYDPLAGQVLLDGWPIDQLNIQEYRKHISLVSQEPTLYAGTIRFNVLLGATKPESEVTQEDIEAACRNANILDFIQSLPNKSGFDTEVGGKGSQLSGGQKQRIAIARALLRNPKVLLLDEATSALDSSSEKVVQEALDQAAKGRTTIAVAHRLSTIQNADCIYFLKEGRVSEAGTHDELLSLRKDYYQYVQLQALNR